MKNRRLISLVFASLFGLLLNFSFAQEADDYKLYYKFSTLKQADNTRLLEVSFVGRNKEDRKDVAPIYDAEIYFYNLADTFDLELGVAKTDNEGFARLTLPEDFQYYTDDEGFIRFKAEFKGSDALKKKRKKLKVKDIFLDLDLSIVDSVKTVTLKATTLDSANNRIPVEEADVIFSVGGMISNMPIEDETLEEGEYQFEFPNDIPGDKNGMIEVHAFIDDHDDFGSVRASKTVDWGTFDDQVETTSKTLWSDVAPIWMYVVLTILLLGVWGNYVYTIFSLIKIKKAGDQEK